MSDADIHTHTQSDGPGASPPPRELERYGRATPPPEQNCKAKQIKRTQ